MATSWTEETIETGAAPATPVRVYRSGDVGSGPMPLVLHLHGGAFIDGSLDSGRVIPTLLAEAGATVVSVDYPHAPKHRFPHALQTAFGALKWLHKSRSRWSNRKSHLFVAGEEAGGNLAAGLALMARDQQTPAIAGRFCFRRCSIRGWRPARCARLRRDPSAANGRTAGTSIWERPTKPPIPMLRRWWRRDLPVWRLCSSSRPRTICCGMRA